MKGVTSSREGFRVFTRRLEHFVSSRNPSSQASYILSSLKKLRTNYGSRWENEKEWEERLESPGFDGPPVTAKDAVIKYHFDMTDFLQKIRFRYSSLVAEHLFLATRPLAEVPESYPSDPEYGREDFDTEIVASMESYFDSLPELVDRLRERNRDAFDATVLTSEEVEDAWFSMMFRAFCWQRSHIMIEGVPPLPSEYWNSKMPVYIG